MNQFFDVMLDVESMGTSRDAALMQIGAVFFDVGSRQLGPTFLQNVHLATSVREGGTMDAGTVLFWMGQSEQARKVRFGGLEILDALADFATWMSENCRREDVRVWGNSNSFDCGIVASAYERLGVEAPWHWSRERDFRTWHNGHPRVKYDPAEKGDDAHDALQDALFQAKHMFRIADAYGGRGMPS